MSSLSERIKEILDELGISARELSRRAGLPEVHVGMLIRRSGKSAAAVGNAATITAIATAAGVEVRWLAIGQGPKRLSDSEEALIRRLADLQGIPAKHVESALATKYAKRAGPLDKLNMAQYLWDLAEGVVEPSPVTCQCKVRGTPPRGKVEA